MDKATLVPSLPPAWYYTEEHFEKEKSAIFEKDWVFFCHTQQIPENGDYVTGDIAGIPVAVLRDDKGQIQVLLNVCRHRGALVLPDKKGRLTKPTLMCQYHGWCYNMDGSFKQAPFLPSANYLLDLKKVYWQDIRGMIFISFNPEPTEFDSRRNEILQEMDSAQFKIDQYRYHSQIIRTGDFNWKTWIEGFQECYHCPTIHAGFNKDFNLAKYEVHNKDHFSLHQCPRKNPSATGSFEGLWLWLYPNCGLPCYEKVYYSLRVNPTSPSRTELIYTFFTNDQFNAEDESQFFDFVTKITDEDIHICEQVQRNLEACNSAELFPNGYLNMSRENGVYYFHQLVREAIERNTKKTNKNIAVS